MADRKQLEDALIAAHNAGDTEAAQVLAGEIKAIDAPDNSVSQWARVMTRAAAPHAMATGGGAMAGSVIPGMGTLGGAGLGELSLAGGDMLHPLINTVTGRQDVGPSEALRDVVDPGGTGKPQTAMQRIVASMVDAGAGSFLLPTLAAPKIASALSPGSTSRVVAEALARNPGMQGAAGAAAGGAGQTTAELGGGPGMQTAAELFASLAAGKIGNSVKARVANRPPSRTELKTMADAEYEQAKKIQFDPKDVNAKLRTDLNAALNNPADPQLNRRLHPKVAEAVDDFRDMLASAGNKPIPFSRMEQVRKLLTRASISDEADERRVAGLALDKLDAYVNSTAAKSARELWARRSKAEVINLARERAELAPGDQAAAVKAQFRSLANQLAKNSRGFRKDEIAAIRKVAEGGKVENLLQALGMLAPGSSLRGTQNVVGLGGGGYALGALGAGPVAAVGVPLAIGGTAIGARGIAKALARRSAADVDRLIRRGEPVPKELLVPYLTPAMLDSLRNRDKRKR